MTREEQIIAHLTRIQNQNEDDRWAPFAASAYGIAAATGMTLGNARLTVLRLVKKGKVIVLLRRVPENRIRRLKTYRVASNGGGRGSLHERHPPTIF